VVSKAIKPQELQDLRKIWEEYDAYGGHHRSEFLVGAVPVLLKEIERLKAELERRPS